MRDDLKRLYARYAPGQAVPETPPEGAAMDLAHEEPPLLDRAGLEQLKRQFASEPAYTLERVRNTFDADMTAEELRDLIVDLSVVFEDPGARVAYDLAFEAGLGKTVLPKEFTFPRMNLAKVPIDVTDCRFETKRDAVGWALNAGPFFLRGKIHQPKVNFRWAENYQSLFSYRLRGERKTRLALFSDAGTGLYHSRYIGEHIGAEKWDHVIYLGDVYYSGKSDEFQKRFTGPQAFESLIAKNSLWTLNANHEMFSAGAPYFAAIDARRNANRALNEQEGSYFCLRGDKFQVIGIDTAYHDSGRHAEPKLALWLQQMLREGKSKGLVNILCSGDEPYTVGSGEFSALLADVTGGLAPNMIDLWLFGNVHYAAFFDRQSDKGASFLGACIGHGGYPYTCKSESERWSAVPVRWLETEPRFPTWTGVRQDRGNNGYVTLELDNETGSVSLEYIDWTADVRYRATLSPQLAGGPLVVTGEERRARALHGKL